MYSNDKDDIKKELKKLCLEYVDILERLKKEKVINDETYDSCSSNKFVFLEDMS